MSDEKQFVGELRLSTIPDTKFLTLSLTRDVYIFHPETHEYCGKFRAPISEDGEIFVKNTSYCTLVPPSNLFSVYHTNVYNTEKEEWEDVIDYRNFRYIFTPIAETFTKGHKPGKAYYFPPDNEANDIELQFMKTFGDIPEGALFVQEGLSTRNDIYKIKRTMGLDYLNKMLQYDIKQSLEREYGYIPENNSALYKLLLSHIQRPLEKKYDDFTRAFINEMKSLSYNKLRDFDVEDFISNIETRYDWL